MKSYLEAKNDPLYESWCNADKIHRASIKRYCDEFSQMVEAAKLEIESSLKEKYGPQLKVSSEAVDCAFHAYQTFYLEHPPQNESIYVK